MRNIKKLHLTVAFAAVANAAILMLNEPIFGETKITMGTFLNIFAITLFSKQKNMQSEDAVQRAII